MNREENKITPPAEKITLEQQAMNFHSEFFAEFQEGLFDLMSEDNSLPFGDFEMTPAIAEIKEKNRQLLEENKEWYDNFKEQYFPCKLKQQVEESRNKILEENKPWYDKFVAEHFPESKSPSKQETNKPTKRPFIKRKPVWISLSSAAAAAVLIISLIFIIPLFTYTPYTPTPPPNFSNHRRRYVDSNLDEMNNYIRGLRFEFDDDIETRVRRTYDWYYMQNLYFQLDFECEDGIILGTIAIYTNRYFTPEERIFTEPTETTVGNFDVVFHKEFEFDDPIYTLNYRARIEHNDIIIYIEYRELALDEYGSFFDFITETIQVI